MWKKKKMLFWFLHMLRSGEPASQPASPPASQLADKKMRHSSATLFEHTHGLAPNNAIDFDWGAS